MAERDAAMDRLIDCYLHATAAADRHLARRNSVGLPAITTPPPAHAPPLSMVKQAASWIDAERNNLYAAVEYAALHGRPAHAIAIPILMHDFLRTYGHWAQQDRGLGPPQTQAAIRSLGGFRGIMMERSTNTSAPAMPCQEESG